MVFAALASAAAAQVEPPAVTLPLGELRWLRGEPAAAARATLALLAPDTEALRNAAPFLDDLQRRATDDGLQVVALLAQAPTNELLAQIDGGFAVGLHALGAMNEPRAWVLDGKLRLLWNGWPSSGMTTWVEAALAGQPIAEDPLDDAFRLETLGEVEDHETEDLRKAGAALIARNARNPDGWILRLIVAIERDVDYDAARAIARDAFEKLGRDAPALTRFVDKLLRTVRDDRELLQQCLMALIAVAPGCANDLDLQLQYLRVLGALGRKREAELLVRRLQEQIAQRPAAQAAFAEALAFGALAPNFADIAHAAIEAARERDPDDRELAMIQHNVLAHCARDEAAAAALAERLMRDAEYSINDDAWYLMVREPGRGRFDRLAMAFCERLLADGDLGPEQTDTVGLALFLNGRSEEAIATQEKALAMAGKPTYARRLERFRKHAALRAAAREPERKR
jgi:hypothetical protein